MSNRPAPTTPSDAGKEALLRARTARALLREQKEQKELCVIGKLKPTKGKAAVFAVMTHAVTAHTAEDGAERRFADIVGDPARAHQPVGIAHSLHHRK